MLHGWKEKQKYRKKGQMDNEKIGRERQTNKHRKCLTFLEKQPFEGSIK